MLDIKFIRENKDLIKEAVRKKHITFDVDELIGVDNKRRDILAAVEKKRSEQNDYNTRIASATTEGERRPFIESMQMLKALIQKDETALAETMKQWQKLMVGVPNIPDISVPEGASDAENKEIRVHGDIPKFSFTPKSHMELMEGFDLADFKRGATVAGFRGYFLKGSGAELSFALWQFALEELTKKGFVPMIVPSLVKREAFIGTGYLPQGEEDLYKTQDDTYLAGTAEVATMAYYMDEILDKQTLPVKMLAFSPCFRREAGSHGKDTKGVIRVHEFMKLEQVVLCEANHTESVKFHEELTANAEDLLKALQLPYRVVANCGGDLGLGQVKKYDLEAWLPSENAYRETHSSSYFHDFQTRRLNIRYKDTDGKLRFAHSLNNTAIATPRILAPLLENNQEADGSIRIPLVLQKYCGGKTVITG